MRPIKIILNPVAGRGHGAKVEPELRRLLEAKGVDFDLIRTTGTWHAAELAERAASASFETIVAAGGDGTVHEVVNGLMAASKGSLAVTLGVIPIGSGSDFANTVGLPADLQGACQRLAQDQTRVVDVCRVTVDDRTLRYFANTVNVGFGGIVTRESRKIKWVRGLAQYLPAVLKAVFLSQPPRMTIEYDDQELAMPTAMICVANGPREGGGFFCTPDALPDDGLFDLCIVGEISQLAMLGLIPHFIKGTHIDHDSVTMARTGQVVISSPDDLIAHADGEMLCISAHRLEFEMLPQRLRVMC